MNMIRLAVGAVLLSLLTWGIVLDVRRKLSSAKPDPLACAVIHKPAKAECPKGYAPEATPRFTEKDGSKEFACLSPDPTKEQCTDMLKSGESETLRFYFSPLSPAVKPAGERKL